MKPQRVGRLTVQRVMEVEDSSPLAMFMPDISAADLQRVGRWFSDSDIAPEPADARITLGMHSFVIQLDGQNILVDACSGNHKQRSIPNAHMLDNPYLENLAAAGFRPEDIHLVLCTHLHFDHVGWNTQLRERALGADLPQRALPVRQARLRALCQTRGGRATAPRGVRGFGIAGGGGGASRGSSISKARTRPSPRKSATACGSSPRPAIRRARAWSSQITAATSAVLGDCSTTRSELVQTRGHDTAAITTHRRWR